MEGLAFKVLAAPLGERVDTDSAGEALLSVLDVVDLLAGDVDDEHLGQLAELADPRIYERLEAMEAEGKPPHLVVLQLVATNPAGIQRIAQLRRANALKTSPQG